MSKLVTAAQASAPSGESVGAPMRLIAHSASTVSGGLRLSHGGRRDAAWRGRRGHRRFPVRTMEGCDSTVRARRIARLSAIISTKIRTMTTMQYRRLGASGLKVSELSFGSWVTYGNQMGDRPRARVHGRRVRCRRQLLRQRRGVCEGPVGNDHGRGAPKARLAALVVHRLDQVLLGLARRSEREEHAEPQIPDAGDRRARSRASALDYVDLVFCHRADPDTPIEETVYAMHDMIAAGKALYWGTSEWSAAEIMAAWQIADRHHLHKPVMEQPQYNLLHRERVEERIRAALRRHRARHDDLEPARVGAADRQVQRRHSAGLARHIQGLRMARREAVRSGEDRRGAAARADRARISAARSRRCRSRGASRIRTCRR